MAENMKLEISGNAIEKFEYTAKHIDGWVRSAVGDKAHSYKDYVRGNFTRFLNDRGPGGTGTRESIQAWTPKRNRKANVAEWYIRPGVRIPGMLNYLYKWIGTSRDFMNRTFAEWTAVNNVGDYITDKIEERFNALK